MFIDNKYKNGMMQ